MVEVVLLEELIPALLSSVVANDGNFELLFPLRVGGQDGIARGGPADRPGDVVAGFNEGVDDVGRHEGVGTGNKRGRHCEVLE